MTQSCCEHQLREVSGWIQHHHGTSPELSPTDDIAAEQSRECSKDEHAEQVEMLLIQHQEWYHLALLLALVGDKQVSFHILSGHQLLTMFLQEKL